MTEKTNEDLLQGLARGELTSGEARELLDLAEREGDEDVVATLHAMNEALKGELSGTHVRYEKPGIETEARDIVEGARQEEYGGPEDSFDRISRLWNAHLQNRGIDAALTGADVALMMDLMKTARLVTTPDHRDSLVDKIGYTIAYAKTVGVEA